MKTSLPIGIESFTYLKLLTRFSDTRQTDGESKANKTEYNNILQTNLT